MDFYGLPDRLWGVLYRAFYIITDPRYAGW